MINLTEADLDRPLGDFFALLVLPTLLRNKYALVGLPTSNPDKKLVVCLSYLGTASPSSYSPADLHPQPEKTQ
jgi:hypothetical protein